MPTEPDDGRILVGVVARAHGLGGEVVVDSTTDTPERFEPGSALTAVFPSGKTEPLRVAASRPFAGRLLVRFEGVATRDAADALRGADLTIARSEVRPLPEGRYYRFELLGLCARTREGEALGTVIDVFSTGSNDVLVVRGDRGEVLVPLLPEVLVGVDRAERVITLAPPSGLPGWDDER